MRPQRFGAPDTSAPPKCLADAVKVVSSDARREILIALIGNLSDVSELTRNVERSMPEVSRQLGWLRRAGVIEMKSRGKRHVYSLSKSVTVGKRGGRVSLRIWGGTASVEITDAPEAPYVVRAALQTPRRLSPKP